MLCSENQGSVATKKARLGSSGEEGPPQGPRWNQHPTRPSVGPVAIWRDRSSHTFLRLKPTRQPCTADVSSPCAVCGVHASYDWQWRKRCYRPHSGSRRAQVLSITSALLKSGVAPGPKTRSLGSDVCARSQGRKYCSSLFENVCPLLEDVRGVEATPPTLVHHQSPLEARSLVSVLNMPIITTRRGTSRNCTFLCLCQAVRQCQLKRGGNGEGDRVRGTPPPRTVFKFLSDAPLSTSTAE